MEDRELKKVVCDTAVCERWRVTKKDGVCDKVVCERWCVKVVCGRWCVTKLCVKDGVVKNGV